MTLERRFQAGFEEEATDDPGLVLGQDGVVRVVTPSSSRSELGLGLTVVSVPVTHAQLLALNGTPIELVPAQGEGIVIIGPATGHGFLLLDIDTSAAVYTNVAGSAVWQASLGNSSAITTYLRAADLMTFGARGVQLVGPFDPGGTPPTAGNPDEWANQPLRLRLNNVGAGELTDGAEDNHGTIRVGYMTLTL